MGKFFGTDGIRGVANRYPMDAATAMAAGRAIAWFFRQTSNQDNLIIIGQDTRRSGDMIAQAVGAGVCSAGVDVSFLGVIPTPAVACLTRKLNAVAGIVISASHNPFEDNGIKVFAGSGYKLSDAAEEQIEALMEINAVDITNGVSPGKVGRIKPVANPTADYIAFLLAAAPSMSLENLSVVLDCANGATYRVAPQVFNRLGADVIPTYCAPDGININHHCGSQHPQVMAERVISEKADLGLAFDGDGDRLIAVDEKGATLTGDQIMAICAKDLAAKGRLKHNTVVSTVMSNMGFHQAMRSLGISLFTTQVGDRYVMQEMIERDAIMGGEDSGHMIFRDAHTTGDGILAALRLLDAMGSSSQTLSELSKAMTVFPQALINVDVRSKPDLASIVELQAIISQVEKDLDGQGRVLVRYSGTQPQCRVMVEGPNRDQTRKYCEQIAKIVQAALG